VVAYFVPWAASCAPAIGGDSYNSQGGSLPEDGVIMNTAYRNLGVFIRDKVLVSTLGPAETAGR